MQWAREAFRRWAGPLAMAVPIFAAVMTLSAQAEPGYPNRPVRVIVPYGPGGVADTTTRIVAQKLNERLGQQFVIDNRPGAGGIVAAKAGASAPPDGYTLTLTGNGTAISKSLFKSLPYDVLRDFTSISVMAWLDLLFATKADGPLKTVSRHHRRRQGQSGQAQFRHHRTRQHAESVGGTVQAHRRRQRHHRHLPHHAGTGHRA